MDASYSIIYNQKSLKTTKICNNRGLIRYYIYMRSVSHKLNVFLNNNYMNNIHEILSMKEDKTVYNITKF